LSTSGEVISTNKLWKDWDESRNCSIFDTDLVVDFLEPFLSKGSCIVDFHTSDFFPERWFDIVVLLRCDNTVLYKRLEARGYAVEKITENGTQCVTEWTASCTTW
jgi:adenylate kinase